MPYNTNLCVEGHGEKYLLGDRVRIKKYNDDEYIGEIIAILPSIIKIDTGNAQYEIAVEDIAAMRLAKDGETFANKWNY